MDTIKNLLEKDVKTMNPEEFQKARQTAVIKITQLLNKYSLTIKTEHQIKIIPKELDK